MILDCGICPNGSRMILGNTQLIVGNTITLPQFSSGFIRIEKLYLNKHVRKENEN